MKVATLCASIFLHAYVGVAAKEKTVPAAVNNLVLIRHRNSPAYFSHGLYFRQADGRSIIVTAELIEPKDLSFIDSDQVVPEERYVMEFHPGQIDQRQVPVRVLARVGLMTLLEVVGEMPPPVEMDWSLAQPDDGKDIRVFGFIANGEPRMPTGIKFAEVSAQYSGQTALKGIDRRLAGGALACDSLGIPFGILWNPHRTSAMRGVIKLSDIFASTEPVASAHVEVHGRRNLPPAPPGRTLYRVRAGTRDPLKRIESYDVFVGTLPYLKAHMAPFNRPRFNELITEDMKLVKTQLRPNPAGSFGVTSFGFHVSEPGDSFKTTYHVTQTRVRLSDGTEYFGPAGVTPPDDIDGPYPLSPENLNRFSRDSNATKRRTRQPNPYLPISQEIGEVLNERYAIIGDTLVDRAAGGAETGFSARSLDGQFLYNINETGNLRTIRISDRTSLRTIDYFEPTAGLGTSQAGIAILACHTIRVLEPATLQVLREISVPGAIHIATSKESTHAFVVTENSVWHVNLSNGMSKEVEIDTSGDVEIPTERFTGITILEGGKVVVLSDKSGIHRCLIESEALLRQE